jgi:porin
VRLPRKVVCTALAIVASAGAHADVQQDQTLTGDWNGLRTTLADRGIAPYLTYTPGAWANTHGGIETGVRYEALADLGVNFDLARLFDWSGARFHIDWHWNLSDLPSQHLIGQFATDAVTGYEAVNSVRFYEIYFEQHLPGDHGRVKAGQITMDDDFFISQYAGSLINASFALFGSGREQQLAPFYPVAAPGLYIEVKPSSEWTVRGGIYTVDVGNDVGSNHGFEWSMSQGSTGALEIATNRTPAGLPGTYTLGIIGTSKTVIDFRTGSTAQGSTGLYVMMDQALVVGTDGQPKIGGFLRIGYDPLLSRALLQYYGNAGFTVSAPFTGRPNDSFSAGISHTAFAPDYVAAQRAAGESVTDHESIVELNYAAVINGWLTLQPDFQLVLNPHYSDETAWVFGLQASIKF